MKSQASCYLYLWHDGAIGIRIVGDTAEDPAKFDLDESGDKPVVGPGFDDWLKQCRHDRFHVLIDTVDESHVIEEIPRLARRDRDNLIKKRIAQRFRESEFVASRLLPVQKLPRRRVTDKPPPGKAISGHRVYLCGLIDEQAAKPWIDALLANKIRIASFTSPPLLAPNLLPRNASQSSGLLLSIAKGGLRQTLLIDGVVHFSRLAIVHDTSALAIRNEINRTIQYLTTSRRLTRDQVSESRFTIWIVGIGLAGDGQLPETMNFDGDQSARIQVLPADDFAPLDAGRLRGLTPWVWAVRKGSSLVQYATPRLRHFDFCGIWKRRMWVGSSGLAALGMVLALSAGLVADLVLPDTSTHVRSRERSQSRANDLNARLSQYGVSADEVLAITKAADRLRRRHVGTGEMLELVAAGIGGDTGLRLARIQWNREALSADKNSGAAAAPMTMPGAMPGAPGMAANASEPGVPIRLTISGTVDHKWSKTDANDRVSALLQRLLAHCDCQLERLTLPYDPAPAASLSQSFVSESTSPLAFDIELVVNRIQRAGVKS
ncbi:MAG: hypothetical protein R3E83_09975 [Burkholderiaceae bacterium]